LLPQRSGVWVWIGLKSHGRSRQSSQQALETSE
jgi:hypothetical protein